MNAPLSYSMICKRMRAFKYDKKGLLVLDRIETIYPRLTHEIVVASFDIAAHRGIGSTDEMYFGLRTGLWYMLWEENSYVRM